MSDNVTVGSGGVDESVSMLSAVSNVSGDEENKDDEEECYDGDDDEVDHTKVPQEMLRACSPTARTRAAPVWQHLKRIAKFNMPDREIQEDRTHMCVYPLSDDESGSKRYCNTPLKLFKGKSGSCTWSTTAAVLHFNKKHPQSDSARKCKTKLELREGRMGEAMHLAGSASSNVGPARKSFYGLTEREKMLSAIARWGKRPVDRLKPKASCPYSPDKPSRASYTLNFR